MSKIFDALNKDPRQLPEVGIWSLSETFKEKVTALESAGNVPADFPNPEPLLEALPAPIAATPVAIAPVAQPAPDAPKETPALGIRTMPVRITKESPLFPYEGDHWQAAEQYRVTRTKIVHHPLQPRMLVVSSATPADGKTLTAINLAAAMAMKGEGNVLLADADFRLSSVHDRLGFPSSPGLADVLSGEASLEQSLIQAEQFPGLYVLPAGTRPKNPTEVLTSSRWRALCGILRSSFRYIILDSPPIGAVADYELIQAECDGVLLVIRPDHTSRKPCFQAIKAVPQDKLVGVLLNCVPKWFMSRDCHYSEYNYGYGSRQTNEK
jgi:protein-tyrosine kinase